ncbi:Transmembrane protein 145 [Phytophthora citrophthora]|uniref:Transmembrane protein 145 n=1 Tax=Phytophthora citrophthora TaxID=4793 RepID=A0AAD9H239_9STRA|nr:Transmembrane protein 145 [Phytophthora citrophthora]
MLREIETDVDGLQVAVYDDEALFWNYVMTDSSCDCKCKVSTQHTKGVFNVTAINSHHVTPFTFSVDIHEHLRPRFWYVALARCVPGGDQYKPSFAEITEANFRKYYFSSWFSIHMTQGDGSELPVQQQGMPTIYAVMTAVAGVAAAAQLVAVRSMTRSESFHPIMRILTLVVVFFFLCNALLCIHFTIYESNGLGVPFFKYAANITEVFVRVGTLLLAMVIAKGWTINSVALDGQIQLSCVILAILVLYLSMAMWYLVWLDPASTLYIYDSWPGLGICLLQMCVLGWFVNTIMETRSYEKASTKRSFFLRMCCLFSVFFVALPVIVLIASFLSPWVREKTVAAITTSLHCLIYLVLIYMLWPTRAPSDFERLYSVSSPSEKASLRDQHLPTEEL